MKRARAKSNREYIKKNKDNHLSAFPMSGSLRERVHWCRVASFTTEGVKPVLTNSCGIGIQETMWMRQEWGSVFK